MMLGVLFGGAGLLSGGGLLKMGMMAASALGMYLLNGNKEKGEIARLDDLKVSCSSYGRGIPVVYGTMRVTGNMFWATDFEEVLRYTDPKQKGGKKGEKKGTPYYEYFANFAMMLCEGPVEEILRIWADSNLIYDKHNPKNPDLVSIGFSRQDSGGGKSGFGMSKKKGGQGGDSGRFTFRFYSGTESQLPDPFMVRKQGPDMVPGHRGTSYLFFEHFALMDFGNRTPTITAEVAVRKKMDVTFNVLENMPNANQYRNITMPMTFVDPERYKMYVEEQHEPPGGGSYRCIRIYDLSTNREVKRVNWLELAQLNGLDTSRLFTIKWIGVAGTGDLVFGYGSSNSHPIFFVDPNTFRIKKWFGRSTISLSNTASSIVWATNCTPATYVDVEVNIDGTAEITPKRASIIMSFFGAVYIFGEQNEPLVYFGLPTGDNRDRTIPVPASADVFGGTFFLVTSIMNAQRSTILKVDWKAIMNENVLNGIKSYSPNLSAAGEPAIRKIREIQSPGGYQFLWIHNAQVLSGAEVFGWLESYDYDDPLKTGIYAVAVDALSQSADIIWNYKISNDVGQGPSYLGTNPMYPLPTNSGSKMKWFAGSRVYEVDFKARTASFYTTGNDITKHRTQSHQMYWPARGAILIQILDPEDNRERKWAMALIDRANQMPVGVRTITTDVCERVGIPTEKVDVSKLTDDEIVGYVIENPTSGRKVIEQLAQLFMFDVVESDYTLKFLSRGSSSTLTIPQKDLGVVDNDTHDHFIETRVQEIDLPQTVVVSYINPEHDYNVHSQHYRRPRSPMHTMQSRDKLELQLPMAMDADSAKQIAHKVCMSLWTERINYQLLLPWKYLPYDPADVIKYEMDSGLTFEIRMMKMDLGANFSIEAEGVAQTPASYTSTILAGGLGGVIPIPTPWTPQTEAHAMNIPYMDDADDLGNAQWGFYWGAGALGPGLKAAIVEQRLPSLDWELTGLTKEELVWGSVLGTVPAPPWGPHATDDQTVISLLPAHSYEDTNGYMYSWESIPEDDWPTTKNMIVIGEEIIQFRDVELMPDGMVNISHLIRGCRGTENAAYKHVPNERFCIRTGGVDMKNESFASINTRYMFRSFSTYSLFPPYRYDVFMEGATHKPWGPANFKRRKNGNNIIVSWDRRTRLGGEMKNGTATVPLNEESQRFEIYFLDRPFDPTYFSPDNPATYIRKFPNVTGLQLTYTAAQMTADGYNQKNPIYVVGYQISGAVGRGFPGYATLYETILIEV